MKNIFVGKLNFGATEQDIRFLFEKYGNVGRVTVVVRDWQSRRPKGFGFVIAGSAKNDVNAQVGKHITSVAVQVLLQDADSLLQPASRSQIDNHCNADLHPSEVRLANARRVAQGATRLLHSATYLYHFIDAKCQSHAAYSK